MKLSRNAQYAWSLIAKILTKWYYEGRYNRLGYKKRANILECNDFVVHNWSLIAKALTKWYFAGRYRTGGYR